ncbi:uncharacterized protein LOC109900701 isoform X2 [Oncorhynchus kisutch]|nr:uncharacterized protein LOC109900701 isoform X2 [Oncorhynchus kisutch]
MDSTTEVSFERTQHSAPRLHPHSLTPSQAVWKLCWILPLIRLQRNRAGSDREGRRGSAMGQLCCFPFSRAEEKISVKRGPEPDDEELLSLSKRLVEDAVLLAVQQFMDETQHNGAASSDPARPSDNLNTNAVKTTDTSASSK